MVAINWEVEMQPLGCESLLGLLVVISSYKSARQLGPLAPWDRKIDPVARQQHRLHKHGGIRGQGA